MDISFAFGGWWLVVGGRWYSTVGGGGGGLVVFLMLIFRLGCGMAWLGGDFGWLVGWAGGFMLGVWLVG